LRSSSGAWPPAASSFLIYAIDFASWAIRLTAAVYHRRKKGKLRQWNLAEAMAGRGYRDATAKKTRSGRYDPSAM